MKPTEKSPEKIEDIHAKLSQQSSDDRCDEVNGRRSIGEICGNAAKDH
jgi:hypothetical protein